MYRGFIPEVGWVVGSGADGLRVRAPKACQELVPGGSVSVAGVCVSAVELDGGVFRAELSSETLRRSTLAELQPGAAVNVETPLRVGDAIEGHLVQGHVDAIAKVLRVEEEASGRRVWLRAPSRFLES